jgi:hypothetical protein
VTKLWGVINKKSVFEERVIYCQPVFKYLFKNTNLLFLLHTFFKNVTATSKFLPLEGVTCGKFRTNNAKILAATTQNWVSRDLCIRETHSRNPRKLNTKIGLRPWIFYTKNDDEM